MFTLFTTTFSPFALRFYGFCQRSYRLRCTEGTRWLRQAQPERCNVIHQSCVNRLFLAIDIKMPKPSPSVTMAVPP
jgi:hypothetical protein